MPYDGTLAAVTWPYRLRRGHVSDPAGGACAMAVLAAGPQGEPWSVDAVDRGVRRYADAGGPLVLA